MSAGGTGGHILPALSIVAENLASSTPADDVLWLGTAGEMEETLVPRVGLTLETISGGGLHGVGLRRLLPNALNLLRGWRQARQVLRRFRPDVLLLTGGYTNGPAALAAWEKRVPMLIFLPDIEPALSIKVLSRLSRTVACTASASQAYLPAGKALVTGYPLRPDLVPPHGADKARQSFGLAPDLPTLLVFGGSRGARTINTALMAILPELLAEAQVIHISGTPDWLAVRQNAESLPGELRARYRPFEYLHDEMGEALRAADLVVSRAGASTLGEFPAFALPSILVPYPFAWRYQKVNADYMARAGAAVRMNDEAMAEELLPTIRQLLHDAGRLERMRAAARQLNTPNAARTIADSLVSLARGEQA